MLPVQINHPNMWETAVSRTRYQPKKNRRNVLYTVTTPLLLTAAHCFSLPMIRFSSSQNHPTTQDNTVESAPDSGAHEHTASNSVRSRHPHKPKLNMWGRLKKSVKWGKTNNTLPTPSSKPLQRTDILAFEDISELNDSETINLPRASTTLNPSPPRSNAYTAAWVASLPSLPAQENAKKPCTPRTQRINETRLAEALACRFAPRETVSGRKNGNKRTALLDERTSKNTDDLVLSEELKKEHSSSNQKTSASSPSSKQRAKRRLTPKKPLRLYIPKVTENDVRADTPFPHQVDVARKDPIDIFSKNVSKKSNAMRRTPSDRFLPSRKLLPSREYLKFTPTEDKSPDSEFYLNPEAEAEFLKELQKLNQALFSRPAPKGARRENATDAACPSHALNSMKNGRALETVNGGHLSVDAEASNVLSTAHIDQNATTQIATPHSNRRAIENSSRDVVRSLQGLLNVVSPALQPRQNAGQRLTGHIQS